MRILLTGATGFIGHSLYPELVKRGHDVHRLLRYRAGRFDFYGDERVYFADLRDRDAVRKAVLKVRPELLIHLAAFSAVSYSFQNSEEVSLVNYQGTQALADAMVEAGSGCFVHASTSEVYGSASRFPITEDERLSAMSPYAASKIAAEEYLRVMRKTRGLPVAILRPFNSYGRALVDNRHFVAERAITQALTDGVISLHDPRPLRDFLFRDDHVAAYLCLVDQFPKGMGEAINICTGTCWSISEMADSVATVVSILVHRKIEVNFLQQPDRPLDIDRLQGDNTKARELLGWRPEFELYGGLEKAVGEWQHVLTGGGK